MSYQGNLAREVNDVLANASEQEQAPTRFSSPEIRSEIARRGVETRRRRRGIEHALQIRVAAWLHVALKDAPSVYWTSIDPGFTSARAAHFRKLRGVKGGFPDLLLLKDRKAFMIELKAPGGAVSKPQKALFELMKAVGCPTAVCYSGEEVEKALRRWRFPVAVPFGWYPSPVTMHSRNWRRLTIHRSQSQAARDAWRRRKAEAPIDPEELRRELAFTPPEPDMTDAEWEAMLRAGKGPQSDTPRRRESSTR